ncbi:MAG: hypothetical protein K2X27_08245 [Candidatus Obscuribacterales bacterium]|nr:hypothetical protein [Candidatus Obscuribacterales bacterium]
MNTLIKNYLNAEAAFIAHRESNSDSPDYYLVLSNRRSAFKAAIEAAAQLPTGRSRTLLNDLLLMIKAEFKCQSIEARLEHIVFAESYYERINLEESGKEKAACVAELTEARNSLYLAQVSLIESLKKKPKAEKQVKLLVKLLEAEFLVAEFSQKEDEGKQGKKFYADWALAAKKLKKAELALAATAPK